MLRRTNNPPPYNFFVTNTYYLVNGDMILIVHLVHYYSHAVLSLATYRHQ